MSRRPLLSWWPFNPTEWMERTRLMAPEAQAAVMRLNCAAWTNATKPAHLPDDDATLGAASSLSAAAWKRHKATILELFPVAEHGWRTATLIATPKARA